MGEKASMQSQCSDGRSSTLYRHLTVGTIQRESQRGNVLGKVKLTCWAEAHALWSMLWFDQGELSLRLHTGE